MRYIPRLRPREICKIWKFSHQQRHGGPSANNITGREIVKQKNYPPAKKKKNHDFSQDKVREIDNGLNSNENKNENYRFFFVGIIVLQSCELKQNLVEDTFDFTALRFELLFWLRDIFVSLFYMILLWS